MSMKPTPAASKSSSDTGGKGAKNAPIESTSCPAKACKAKGVRMGFCDEHFHQFKFGLITRTGDPVSDYEKKLRHYEAHRQAGRVGASVRKAA